MSAEEEEDGLGPVDPTLERTPTVLILDTSYSMTHETNGESRIDQLNEGLEFFKDEIAEHDHAKTRVDIALATFGGDVTVEQDFTTFEDWDPPKLDAGGGTPMGEAIETAVKLDEERKEEYRNNGISYNRPIIWLLTDGGPTDMDEGDQTWNRVQDMLEQGTDESHFLFFAMGIGDEANMDVLNELVSVTDEDAIELEEGKFMEVFRIASNSLQKQSEPGDEEISPQVNADSS
ncbi:hypothetical protein Z052_01195 [Halorubrum sp. C191]|uniref:vWA domain-containing protein n=1 Tax=Halorubrum sp. C191 TaxID=1383842 RepID=UPI000C084AEE|nr:VWA domain-containing protein [Halorubrum sp. C191]PHQ43980.1 hypothetical protein Z052_01195 [Halorubrum sp. C191]